MPRRQWFRITLWVLVAILVTIALLAMRQRLDKAHVALAYLLVVLGASAQGGRALGLALSVLTFFCFNFFFLLPYHTLTLVAPLDWLILLAYLITATVAAALLTHAQREAAARIRLAAAAEHAETLSRIVRLKDEVVTAVSHDLRTPLTSIKALAYEIALEGDERASLIGVEADRLNRFVGSLLDLSALNSGALRLNLEVNTVEDVVGAAIAQLSNAINGRELQTRLAEGEVLLGRFDFVYTVRILGNLLENAHKYSALHAPIEVNARRAGLTVEIAVADRGPGIPEAERERVFDPFYRRVDAPTDGSSSGLGLSIARRLAEAQGGTLRFEPRAGGGSVFILSLPAVWLDQIDSPTTLS